MTPPPTATVKNKIPYIFYFLIIIFPFISGCSYQTQIPIPVLEYGETDASKNKNLLIFLRGIGGNIEDFEKYGLVDDVKSRNVPVDIVIPDAHFGYYHSESIVRRLKIDIIDPAREKGYQKIWLAGFSMGGLGSLLYLKNYPTDIDGVLLISPMLGWNPICEEIADAGGISKWEPGANKDQNWEYLIWGWIKEYTKSPQKYPPIYLGYGSDDYIVGSGPILLGTALPKDHVFSIPGNHDYKTLRKIWQKHLDRLEKQF